MSVSFRWTILIQIILFPNFLSGQTHYIIQDLPLVENNLKGKIIKLTDEEKINMLSYLQIGERIEFESPVSSMYDNEIEYFPLDTSGLHYIDLNFDGKLDLIYSSQSGNMGIMSSKIYLNIRNKFVHKTTISGGLLHIEKKESSHSCYFARYPCCDSYTARISKYNFSVEKIAEKDYITSIIGLRHLKGLPDFKGEKSITVKDPSLYAFLEDFKLTVPYFGKRTKGIKDSLKAGYNLKLIDLKGDIRLTVLTSKSISKETWYLVISEPVNDLPKSVYEWSKGDKRRLIGWLKEEAD